MANLQSSIPDPALTMRERMWRCIRKMKTFSCVQLCAAADVDSQKKARDYLGGLVKAGVLSFTPAPQRNLSGVYRLEKDLGVNAPRVRKDGSFVPESGRNRMWRAMSILGRFTVSELAAAASLENSVIEYDEAKYYCSWLCRGGYLQHVATASYRFIPARNTGPKAPQILRVKQLYDPNTDTVVTTGERSGRDDE